MRILWFTNTPMPELSAILGRTPAVVGGWMSSLLEELRHRPDVEIAVATSIAGQRSMVRHRSNGLTYYSLPYTTAHGSDVTHEFLEACEGAVRDFSPQIIHVHGTEQAYGHFTAHRGPNPPAVISIQGLIHVYSRYVTGGISLAAASEAGVSGLLSHLRFALMQRSWWHRGRGEQRILAGNRFFIGRTEWDRAHLMANNASAQYFHCGELLRPPFYQHRWDPRSARKYSIFCTAAHSPLKGFHLVLDAVSLLKESFPEITVRVAGAPWNADRGFGYYGRFLKALIDRRGLAGHVTPLPSLGAEQMAEEMATASVFVIPSLVENSPNSLGEAMLVGTPCVAALVGGIPSMITDGESALGFPSGDAEYLAHDLRRIFVDEALAQRLSSVARAESLTRFDPARVVAAQLGVYRTVIASHDASAGRPSPL